MKDSAFIKGQKHEEIHSNPGAWSVGRRASLCETSAASQRVLNQRAAGRPTECGRLCRRHLRVKRSIGTVVKRNVTRACRSFASSTHFRALGATQLRVQGLIPSIAEPTQTVHPASIVWRAEWGCSASRRRRRKRIWRWQQ